ncbi:hypothetical protein C6P41_001011 [Kluyveromyces marxianus]|nr:hypothetical protein C6P41_001011 [Kluyveromyces marxianus]
MNNEQSSGTTNTEMNKRGTERVRSMVFHTPPYSNPSFDPKQSISESYRDGLSSGVSNTSDDKRKPAMVRSASSPGSHTSSSCSSGDDLSPVSSIPDELMKLIDFFIDDLKQPKYSKPLTIMQLSQIFQRFYERFDRSAQQHFNAQFSPGGISGNSSSASALFNARETKNSGLSSIFNRSRSSSLRNNGSRTRTRTNSQQNFQQLLTPEEISNQIKIQERNNLMVDQIMDLCETEIFRKILQVGTGTGKPVKISTNQPAVNHNTSWKMTNLPTFLALDTKNDEQLQSVGSSFDELLNDTVSPCEKVTCLKKLHDMLLELDRNNTDEILPSMIYLLIDHPRRELFLNLQFIKLFRYHRRLKEKELYVTTNFEAAISFIDSVTTKDLLPFCKHVEEIEIPQLEVISDQIKLPLASEEPFMPDFKRSNSLSDLISVGNVIDSGLRNLMGRLKTYTPPPVPPGSNTPVPLGQHGSSPLAEVNDTLTGDWRRYKDSKFEDLKISDMRNIFDIYQNLANKSK